jgi:dipeptidyl aminopeptidase/acylaminoacyl peptidase
MAVLPQSSNFLLGIVGIARQDASFPAAAKYIFNCVEESSESLVYMLRPTSSASGATEERLNRIHHPPCFNLEKMWKKSLGGSVLVCGRFVAIGLCLLFLALSILKIASAQEDVVAPNENLEIIGIPKIPSSLARQVKRYSGVYGLPLAGWHPNKKEVWLKGISNVGWISRIETPGGTQKTWLYLQASGIYDIYFRPQADYLVYNRDEKGDEEFQLYGYSVNDRKSTPLSNGKSRNTEPVWSNSGEMIVYSSSASKSNGVGLCVMNPFDPNSSRQLVESTGNYLKAYDWSPDDKQILYCEFISNAISKLWLIDVTSGANRLLSTNEKTYFSSPQFSKDGKGVYVITDQGSDFRRLAYFDLKTNRFTFPTANIKWDVEEFQLSPDGKRLAFLINEDGISRLHILNLKDSGEKLIDRPPSGVISDLKWRSNSVDLAFNFKSPRTPNDVYSIDTDTGKIERWAQSVIGGVEAEKFSQAEPIHWKSFDGKMISGFLHRPPGAFTGKRPVIIDIHGGPEDQHRPEFGYEDNFFINELGIVKIYPNVRGSTGYGKAFLNLDNGTKREDSVKDIGALLDWIKTQSDLDVDRVMVQGSSYGGYMALSVAARYNERIRCAISDSGPSNLATFVERTEGWRRDVRRAEFGDERDPKTRAFMEKSSPLQNAQRIKKPLYVIQGKNDPRVPASEAEAIVQAVKKNDVPVWLLLAKDEGHDFVVPRNRDFRLYSTILFVKEHLLM